jgi:hypothetical protein
MAASPKRNSFVPGAYLLRPNTSEKLVSPLVPAVRSSWPTRRSQNTSALACVRIAKYGPRILRLKTSHPSPAATSIGSNTAAGAANQRWRNGCHSHGSDV